MPFLFSVKCTKIGALDKKTTVLGCAVVLVVSPSLINCFLFFIGRG